MVIRVTKSKLATGVVHVEGMGKLKMPTKHYWKNLIKKDDLDAKGRYIKCLNADLWREMNWLKRVRLRTASNRIGSSKSCITLLTR
jgi:hypothetical protein